MIKTLTLGYAGEYGARMMTIDLSEEAAMWPDAAAQLLLVRPGEHTPYPADNAVYADGCMTFTPTKADMAIAGQGYAQVYFYGADGNVLGKSSMMVTHILASLGGDSTEPPSGDELGYYDKLMQQAALAIAAGESAKEDAQSAAESAAKAEAALEEMKNMDADQYLTVDKVVNNFTATEEGYVADARALKVLNDAQTPLELVDFTQYVSALANVSYAQNCFYQKMGRLCILQVEFRVSASLVWDEEGSATTAAGIVPIPNRPETGALTTGEQNMSGKFFINTDGSISFRSPMFSAGTMSGRIIYFPKV